MADTDRTVMSWAVSVPVVDKPTRSNRKSITAVGVPDFENWPRNRFPFRDKKPQTSIAGFRDGEECYRTALYGHLHGKATTHFAVIFREGLDLDLSFRNGHVSGSVVAQQDDIIFKIRRVELREGSPGPKAIHYFHSLHVFH